VGGVEREGRVGEGLLDVDENQRGAVGENMGGLYARRRS
jgi:hypothetical protein